MTGLSDAREKSILDSEYSGTLYLRLLEGTAGQCVNDNGTLPTGLTEVTAGGYAPLAVAGSAWNAAVAGSPTIKSVPKTSASPLTFTFTSTVNLCAYAWTTDNATISVSNFKSGGVFVDVTNTPTVKSVPANNPFNITDNDPIIERLGDPPPGVNPT